MKKIMIPLLSAAFLLSALQAEAQISLSPLFTDNMVMQQKVSAPVWGKASPGSEVTVTTSWDRRSYTVSVADDGRWKVEVTTPKAGGPYSMTVVQSGHEPVTVSNILIGEVWLCAGQSNMEMPVKGTWGGVLNYEQELRDAANYPEIRLMTVGLKTAVRPEDDFAAVGGGWQVCSPETVDGFSATAYFFGREIHRERNVPVGLINSSWGGTVIEAWTSRDALAGVMNIEEQAEMVAGWPEDVQTRREAYVKALNEWAAQAEAYDEVHTGDDVLSGLSVDDADWKAIHLPGYIETIYPALDGKVVVRRSLQIPSSWVGKPLTLHMAAIDDNDVTCFNGVKIGETYGWTAPRTYEVPAEAVTGSDVVVSIRIMDITGTGGISGDDASFYLEGPDGSRVSLAGEWRSKVVADYSDLPPKPLNTCDDPNIATVLYNAMVNPLVPYAIKGVIWYQGCSNENRAYQYRDLMRLMIRDWRNRWGYDFPFYITQLANYRRSLPEPAESMWAELREAQDMAARVVSNTGMAVTMDIGDAYDVHPKNKQEVGRRLALQALKKTYGEKVECSGPVYDGYEIDGRAVRLRFTSVAKGLVVKGDRLEGFAVAGADRVFHWADARVVGDCVEVTCPEVPFPLAVRYAWADNPSANLYNTAGLPAAPFRTDDWPGLTLGAR